MFFGEIFKTYNIARYIIAEEETIINKFFILSKKFKFTHELTSRSKHKINIVIIIDANIDFNNIFSTLLSIISIFVLNAFLKR